MQIKPISGFRSLTTHHCETGSMRHIYEFNEFPISEDMLLGLGAGVGFIYWHIKGTLPFYGGRANFERPGKIGLETYAGRRTGVGVESFTTRSSRKAEAALLDSLHSGEPLMLQVDMGYLPYFYLPEEYHFGAHFVVAGGYDPESRNVLLADRDEKLHTVSLEILAQARGSQFKPFPPRNKWYVFNFDKMRPPGPGEVYDAIHEVTEGMLKPPISNLGVHGIRKAAKQTLKWTESMDREEMRRACFNIYIFIDAEGGTGGGIFRYMYERFLYKAAEITGNQGLAEVGEMLHAIGDTWQQVAEMFKMAAETENPAIMLPEITALVSAIADQEQQAWERLAAPIS